MNTAPNAIQLEDLDDQAVFAALPQRPLVGLILNPTSGRCKMHLAEINDIIDGCAQIHGAIQDEESKMPIALEGFANMPVDILAICGGDGTVSRVLSYLMNDRPFDRLPMIVILPGGTANMTAGDVGFKGTVVSTLSRLVNWLDRRSGKASLARRSILRVEPAPGERAHYGMFFGAGAIVQGIEYTNENIHSRGLKNESSLGMGLVRSIYGIVTQDSRFVKPTQMNIANGIKEGSERDVGLLLMTSLNRLFLNLRPYWGNDNEHFLHQTIIRFPAGRFLRNLPGILRGRPGKKLLADDDYQSENVSESRLLFDGSFTLDGEIIPANRDRGEVRITDGGRLVFLQVVA